MSVNEPCFTPDGGLALSTRKLRHVATEMLSWLAEEQEAERVVCLGLLAALNSVEAAEELRYAFEDDNGQEPRLLEELFATLETFDFAPWTPLDEKRPEYEPW